MKKKILLMSMILLLPIFSCAKNVDSSSLNPSTNDSIVDNNPSENENSDDSTISPSNDPTSNISSDNISSDSNSENVSNNSQSNDTSENISSDSTITDPTITDPPEKKKYAYEPHITDKMASISINTVTNNNEWATKYNRQSKLRNEIEYVEGSVSTSDCEDEFVMSNVAAQVKVRGNYTLEYDQKPIRIKFDKKKNLLGLNDGFAAKSWVLLADYKDLSQTHNALSFYLGNQLYNDDNLYCTDFRYVNLTLNGQYWGVYLLAEQQEVRDQRVNVKATPDDYEGVDIGYFFEYDGYYSDENPANGGDYTFTVNYENSGRLTGSDGRSHSARVNGYTIKSDTYSNEQRTYIKNYVQNVYKIAYDAMFRNTYTTFNDTYTGLVPSDKTNAKDCINDVIDLNSLVDAYLSQEIACDPDIGWSSFYMSADMSSLGSKKLRFEAPWDFDSAYGIKNGYINNGTGLFAGAQDNAWLNLCSSQSWFIEMVSNKYKEMKEADVFTKAFSMIQKIQDNYVTDFANEKTRWPNKFRSNFERTQKANSRTTQKQASDDLIEWLGIRLNYLDGILLKEGGNNVTPTPNTSNDDIKGSLYRFELEDGQMSYNFSVKDGYNQSGKYLGNVSGGSGRSITIEFNSSDAGDAYLYFGLSKRANETPISNWFNFYINNTLVSTSSIVEGLVNGEQEWHTFIRVPINKVKLVKGKNVFKVETNSNDATNIDYVEFNSPYALTK